MQHAFCIYDRDGNVKAFSESYREIYPSINLLYAPNNKRALDMFKGRKSSIYEYKLASTSVSQLLIKKEDESTQLLELEFTMITHAQSGDIWILERARPALMTSINASGVIDRESAMVSMKMILNDLAFMASKWRMFRLRVMLEVLSESVRALA